ncbi:ATP synthase F0 subunit C [Spiroplasma endosymbiont of Crioceris asparagi]|uniref:ATP synthase F0 subunit C n=1 Tax=Spiroplasma endosymbiont of Crioceris asparagi TaxID=3066286 RepID=UPI0030D0F316
MFLSELLTNFATNYINVLSVFLPMLLADGMTDKGLSHLGAGVASVSYAGAAIGQGTIGGQVCATISRNPEMASKVTTQAFVFAGICESGSIYGLIIAILLIFVVG